jgi:hypothetical protein
VWMLSLLSTYKYILVDEDGLPLRKFASKIEAVPYLTQGYELIKLPKDPKADPYQLAVLTLPEALV